MGGLSGVRIIEIAGIGPGPFCGMLLADLGADVIVVERPGPAEIPTAGILRRGKRSLALDLKEPGAIDTVLQLIENADGLIEGMRPGAMERLGLGPEVCLACNPRLAYGRMTGWGQDGPLAQAAGHDNNYIALSGALHYAGAGDVPPVTPPTLVGDLGGGALYLALGLVSAILHARGGGKGQVIDAAIVDGSAHMMNLLLDLSAAGESDALDDTVDYGVLCDMVDRIVETERFALLERLATRVAEVALSDERVDSVRVSVRKLEPPVSQALTTSGVTIERGRR